jgi:hypothetical protein
MKQIAASFLAADPAPGGISLPISYQRSLPSGRKIEEIPKVLYLVQLPLSSNQVAPLGPNYQSVAAH